MIFNSTKERKMTNINKKTVTWTDCDFTCTFEYFGKFVSGGNVFHVISGGNMEPKKNVSEAMFNEYYTINN